MRNMTIKVPSSGGQWCTFWIKKPRMQPIIKIIKYQDNKVDQIFPPKRKYVLLSRTINKIIVSSKHLGKVNTMLIPLNNNNITQMMSYKWTRLIRRFSLSNLQSKINQALKSFKKALRRMTKIKMSQSSKLLTRFLPKLTSRFQIKHHNKAFQLKKQSKSTHISSPTKISNKTSK